MVLLRRDGLGLLAAALICLSLAACSGTSRGGGHHGLALAHSSRHRPEPRHRATSRARHRHSPRRHAPRHPRRIVTSSCRYRDPAASACGSVPSADSCRAVDGGALEDRSCTPGAIDPRVTQGDIHSTICVSGYTDTVRPPVSYTAPLESELIHSYDLSLGPSQTELDHLVSLELGGAPADVRNLWPEPYAGRRGSYNKDEFENRLHAEVCAGAITLAKAQAEIVDFVKFTAPGASSPAPPSGPSSAPAPAPSSGSKCDSNYSGACLDPNASDYDCAGGAGDGPKYVQGPIRVVGTDHYYLDGNGDGIACS